MNLQKCYRPNEMIIMVDRKDLTYILLYLWENSLIKSKLTTKCYNKLLNVTNNDSYIKYEATNFDLYNASKIMSKIRF